ncbi:MAG: hypothetical protein M1826_006457 [Phylliscum demangeonii]|nr:MAG: hypothetical protein M1826_006457 [Phylliscum demangeonii]
MVMERDNGDHDQDHDEKLTPSHVIDPDFPYSLLITIPLPTHRLASSALRALQVDRELSGHVRRSSSLQAVAGGGDATATADHSHGQVNAGQPVALKMLFEATTNRLLRVAVNGFLESMAVVLQVMEELDVDVLGGKKDDG